MKTFSLAILTLLLSAAANGATISGTVGTDTGSPLAAMTVAAYTTAGAPASSGGTTAAGTYALTVPAGTYHLLAYDPKGAFATSFYADAESFDTSAALAVTSAQNVTNINFRLVQSGFVVGRVSSNSGAPLSNITVVAYNVSGTRRGSTTTDATGNYTLALPPGTFKIVAYDDALSYAPTFFDDAISFAAATELTIAATASTTANIRLPPAAKVTGTVTDRATLAPLAALRVTAYSSDGNVAAQSLTASDGKFGMAVRAGELRIVVDDPKGSYATTYVPDAESFSTEAAVNVTAGQTLTVNAMMVRGGRLAGKVTDRVSGAPLANITAVAYNPDGTTRSFAGSDATGAYSIVVPAGDFRVGVFDVALVHLAQFYPDQTTFEAAAPQHVIAQQSIGALDFALAKGARVTAHVTSRTSGAALPAVTVAAYDLAGRLLVSGTTDASGNSTLLVPPGTIKLLAVDTSLQFATGYYRDAPTFDATEALALSEGQSLDAAFVLSDAGRVSGVVMDATTASPLVGMAVIVYDTSFRTVAVVASDAAGAFRAAVPAGAYIVAATDPTHRYGTVFHAGSTTSTGASIISVFAGQDVGPLTMRLAVAPVPPRRRTARH
jgi:hypothetical protein